MRVERPRTLRWLALGLGMLALLTAALVGRVYQAGTAALVQSDRAFDAGQLQEATTAARDAATWYLPQAPHVDAAYRRLRAIAIGAETQGDVTTALRAWSGLRAALIETDHPWSRRRAQVDEASDAVARLLKLTPDPNLFTLSDPDQGAAIHQAYRQSARNGGALFSLLTTLGMLLMLGCGLRLLFGGSPTSIKAGVLVRTGLLVGFGLWVLAALGA